MFTFSLQQKFQDALNVIEGPLGQQLDRQTSHLGLVDNKKIEYFKKLDKWDEVNSMALKLLEKRLGTL
jgi:hypothetical protein